MKEGWEVKKLGEVCEILMGQSPSSDTYNDSADGIPFFQGNADFGRIYPNIRMYCNAPIRIANEGDILISVRAPIGAINISNVKCCIGRGLASIKSKNVNQEFIYHALIANREKLISQGTGSTFKSISKSVLYDLPIPLPPLPEQEKIVAELDCLSGIIEKKKQQLKELDALAQSIFYEMFGDPVENEKGWEVKSIGDVSVSINYGTSSPSNYEGKYKYLRMNNLTYDGYLDLSNTKSIDLLEEDLEKYIVRRGDILFNRTNSKELVGKTALFNLDEEMVIAGYIIRVRVDANVTLPIYVVRYLNTPFMKSYFSGMCKGAVNQANINSKELKAIPLPLPPLSLQHSFASKVEAIEKQKELIKQSIAETELLFNSRMDHYFN